MDEKLILVLICTFMNLLPIIPHGNFYNNWLSIVIYLPLGIYLYLDIKKNRIKHHQTND